MRYLFYVCLIISCACLILWFAGHLHWSFAFWFFIAGIGCSFFAHGKKQDMYDYNEHEHDFYRGGLIKKDEHLK